MEFDPTSAERVQSLITLTRDAPRESLRVVAAACLLDDVIYSMPPPARHSNLLREMASKNLDGGEQGFILNSGQFVTRRAAAALAIRNDQIKSVLHPAHGLYTDDLF